MSRNYVAIIALFASTACLAKNEPAAPVAEEVVASNKARLKFKDGERYGRMLAQALDVDRGDVCLELGRYDCIENAHKIALGGVEAYRQQIFEPLEKAAITAPLAVERVALSACRTRVERDLASPASAAIFKDIAIDGEAITDIGTPEIANAIDLLYRRAMKRAAEPGELGAIRELYGEVVDAGSARPARDWMILSCMAVTTSVEALFY